MIYICIMSVTTLTREEFQVGYTEITAQRLPVLSEPRLIMAKALQALHPE